MLNERLATFLEPSIGQLEILSWTHSFAPPSGSRSAVEQASRQNLTFTKYMDAHSSDLMKACWEGRQFKSAIITAYRTYSHTTTEHELVKYVTVRMTPVVISNYSISGGPGELPVENFTLDCGTFAYEYMPEKRIDESPDPKKELP